MAKKIFSIDVKTNGFWGRPFIIAALVYDETRKESARFVGRSLIKGKLAEEVEKKIIPAIAGISVSYEYLSLLKEFAKFYESNKVGSQILVHGALHTASVFQDMYNLQFIGESERTHLIDIVGNLNQIGEEMFDLQLCLKRFNLSVDFEGGLHNPLYKAAVVAKIFHHISLYH